MKTAQTIVIKFGTSTVTENGKFDMKTMRCHISDIVAQIREGRRIAIVSSGAIMLGRIEVGEGEELGVKSLARAGQHILMAKYRDLFDRYKETGIIRGVTEFQFTKDEFVNRYRRWTRVVSQIRTDIAAMLVPVINENDAISNMRTTLGDNDLLAARVALAIKADALIMMSVENSMVKGRGGGYSKVRAKHMVEDAGIKFQVLEGKIPHVIKDAFEGHLRGYDNARNMDIKALRREVQNPRANAYAKLNRQVRKKVMC